MRALITGVTGQDGSYLAEQLEAAGWDVFGVVRGQRNPGKQFIQNLVPSIKIIDADLLDQSSLQSALDESQPDVVFNLGAITFVGVSWTQPTLMSEVTGLGALRMLEAIRLVNPKIRFVQASSSEMFGAVRETPQHELTPLNPRSPYGVAKAFAHHTTVNYRESYGIHASTAIMFNHESPRRGPEFVTRKVTLGVAAIKRGETNELRLGNLNAERDWGWAPDYMCALPLMAQRDQPDDYVLATGETHSVTEMCDVAFRHVGLDWRDYVKQDAKLFRPADVDLLLGYPWKARQLLNWTPTHTFNTIIKLMVDHDMGYSS